MGVLYLLDTNNENLPFFRCDFGRLDSVCTRNRLEAAGFGLPKPQFVKRIARLYEMRTKFALDNTCDGGLVGVWWVSFSLWVATLAHRG
ncbi:MAG: hypothetical protein DRR19_08090 [Candidatus Parabeggiatoa sp. nov. 1]|nr:MAG: hypothetical protein DRR19_08090 [Gammaproteobacteria bacterium]